MAFFRGFVASYPRGRHGRVFERFSKYISHLGACWSTIVHRLPSHWDNILQLVRNMSNIPQDGSSAPTWPYESLSKACIDLEAQTWDQVTYHNVDEPEALMDPYFPGPSSTSILYQPHPPAADLQDGETSRSPVPEAVKTIAPLPADSSSECQSDADDHPGSSEPSGASAGRSSRKRERDDCPSDAPLAKRSRISEADKENDDPGSFYTDKIRWNESPTWNGVVIPQMPGQDVLAYLASAHGFVVSQVTQCAYNGCTRAIAKGTLRSHMYAQTHLDVRRHCGRCGWHTRADNFTSQSRPHNCDQKYDKKRQEEEKQVAGPAESEDIKGKGKEVAR